MTIATLSQAQQVLNLIIQKKVPPGQLQQLLEGGFLADLLDANLPEMNRADFRKFCGLKQLMPDITELTGITLPEQFVTWGDRIAACGLNWKDDKITEKRFPLTLPAGPRNLVLAHFNKRRTSQMVQQWAVENGYEIAFFDDLLAVGSHPEYKELQLQFPILLLNFFGCVGSKHDLPCLCKLDAARCLNLYPYAGEWGESCRFLLCRKS